MTRFLMKRQFFILIGLIGLLLFSITQAYARGSSENDFQIWAPVILKTEIGERVHLQATIDSRLNDNITNYERTDFESTLGYSFNHNVTLETGLSLLTSPKEEVRDAREFFQELWLRKEIGKHHLFARFRMEEEFEKGSETILTGRIRVGDRIPIGHADIKQCKWFLITEAELFYSFNRINERTQTGVHQARAFVGIGHDITHNMRVQAGYGLRTMERPFGGGNRFDHLLLVRTSYHIQGRGKKKIKRFHDI